MTVLVIGHFAGEGKDDAAQSEPASAAKPSETPAPTETEEPVAEMSVPDVVGMLGDKAKDALAAAGFTGYVKVEDETGDKSVMAASNWTITEQSPAAGETVVADAEFTLKASHNTSEEDADPSFDSDTYVADIEAALLEGLGNLGSFQEACPDVEWACFITSIETNRPSIIYVTEQITETTKNSANM